MQPPLVNITDYPPAIGSNDWWPSYQKVVDAILASKLPGTIYTPGRIEPYLISRPILADAPNLSFVGDGERLSTIQVAGFSDAIQFGVARTSVKQLDHGTIAQSLTPYSDYWIDCKLAPDGQHSYLDASAGPRYGLRTRGIAYAYFQGTPFDIGPVGLANWSSTTQLTIDFAIYNPAGWAGGNNGIRLFGLGSPDAQSPSPFYCGVDPSSSSNLSFAFATSDGVVRRAVVGLLAYKTPMQRISIQVDLTRPAVTAYVNRVQVAVDLSAIGPNWVSRLSLRANEYRQFQLGTCLVDAGFNPGNIVDQTIFGFKLTGATLYKDNLGTTDLTQTSLDGATLNDARQFFAPETAFYALLPLLDQGNDYRYIAWRGGQDGSIGDSIGSGLFLHDTSLGVPDTLLGNAVRDLTLQANWVPGTTGYGRALCHGPIYDFKAQDCIFKGGAHNFGALNGAVGYPIKVRDCEFHYGGDAAIYAQGCGFWWGERLTIKYWGREAIRSLYSFMDLRQVFYAPGGPGDCVLKFHNSKGAILDNHIMDFESGGPALAHVYCEAGPNSGPTNLTLRNVVFGTRVAGADYIVLRGPDAPNAAFAPATLLLENTPLGIYPGIWTVKQG